MDSIAAIFQSFAATPGLPSVQIRPIAGQGNACKLRPPAAARIYHVAVYQRLNFAIPGLR
jgi:hypothetical protein